MQATLVEAARMPSVIPRNSTAAIRERWLDLLHTSSTLRSVVRRELETGVHAIVAPRCALTTPGHGGLDASIRLTLTTIPDMARPLRLSLAKVDQYGMISAEDFRSWMGRRASDIASGRAAALVYVDLAYLEAALLDRLFGSEVDVRFNVPVTMFRRGELTDYANVLEAAARMVFEGRSLVETATRMAQETLARLETYAQAFMRLAGLYRDARWRIRRNTFLMELPARGISLTLRYGELRNNTSATMETWKRWVESLLENAPHRAGENLPRSLAA